MTPELKQELLDDINYAIDGLKVVVAKLFSEHLTVDQLYDLTLGHIEHLEDALFTFTVSSRLEAVIAKSIPA